MVDFICLVWGAEYENTCPMTRYSTFLVLKEMGRHLPVKCLVFQTGTVRANNGLYLEMTGKTTAMSYCVLRTLVVHAW